MEKAVAEAKRMEKWRKEYVQYKELLEEGRLELLYELVASGDLTAEKSAEKAGLSLEDFKKRMKNAGYDLPQ